MQSESGHISINTENILPIIKKWLYSEKDIFVRELVSNAADAILKLEKIALVESGVEAPAPRIQVSVDKTAKTITISDTGLGMTLDELKRYINQVAFSGVQDFVEKYQGKNDDDQVIGHFGLGFYSSFMISDRVEIETKSYQADASAVHWDSKGDGQFTITAGSRTDVGTSITMHVNEDEFLDDDKIKQLATKYCGFIRYPVFVGEEQVSDPRPAWTQNPSQLSDEDYRGFFAKVFPGSDDPLFWVHINMDFPMRVRGILYFPRLGHEMSASEGQVKLFCNQVFVEDNCKELIPEYLTLLKGVIDCADLPLNVSRSALQADASVRKISQHITKKIADKFAGMFKNKREEYEGFWEEVNPFVKYAMMRDSDFSEKMRPYLIYKMTNGKFTTLDEYASAYGERTDKKILYVNDPGTHVHFIKMLQAEGIEALVASRVLDQHFLPYLEMQSGQSLRFQRVDADISKYLSKEEVQEIVDPKDPRSTAEKIESLFKQHLANPELKIKVESLKNSSAPAVLVIDENMRRLREMSKSGFLGALSGGVKDHNVLIINRSSPAIKNLLGLAGAFNRDSDVNLMVRQIYDLAAMQQGQFDPEVMRSFIERSADLLARVGSPS
jgi:molecular chaperone HtpG